MNISTGRIGAILGLLIGLLLLEVLYALTCRGI